jgi:hypothetical protein
MIDPEKYQLARKNMKFVTRSLRSLATKLHILALQAGGLGTVTNTQRVEINVTMT